MARKHRIPADVAAVLGAIALDLATELDLHYDDEDFFALGKSLALIGRARDLLATDGHPVHPDVEQVIERGRRHRN